MKGHNEKGLECILRGIEGCNNAESQKAREEYFKGGLQDSDASGSSLLECLHIF